LQHVISLTPVGRDRWDVSGAVTLTSKTPTADAVHELVALGKAGPNDTVKATWQGAPIVANVASVLPYRPSPVRSAVEGSRFTFMPNNLPH
jgi:hypothetical protein